jgi:hypothetical protein
VVVVFGTNDPNGVKGANGETTLASPTFFFLRSPTPVLGLCGDGTQPGCACPADVVAAGDPMKQCHSLVVGLSDAQARLLEPGRETLDAALMQLLPFAGTGDNGPRNRSDIVLTWNFTIASSPMAVFDPTRGDVPFPNDVLIDQMTGLVNLPSPSPGPEAALQLGLNTLDGFSVTAPETLPIDFQSDMANGDIDPATVTSMSAFMLGVTSNSQPSFTSQPVMVNMGMTFAGQIAVIPTHALESDQIRYAVAVTTSVKDKAGRNLVPPPLMVLVRGQNPLVDMNGHTTVPSVVGDSDAQQLEVLRQGLAPLFDALEMLDMIPRENIAAAWTFTTQSVMRPLMALDDVPTKKALSTDVTIAHVANAAEVAGLTLPFDATHIGGVVIGTFHTQDVSDPTTRTISFARDTIDATATFTTNVPQGAPAEPIRFAMTFPASPSPSPWPVAILQHGFTSWRGDVAVLADGFAAAGWATVMIDMPFHGARSACTADSQCNGSGVCSLTTGQCSTGLLAASPAPGNALACAFKPFTNDDADCEPVATGAAFVDPSNLFASRDNLRQFVVDAAQLERVLADGSNANGLKAQLAGTGLDQFDGTKLAYLGISLGGIGGTLYLSVAPTPTVGVLNVTGGDPFDIIAQGSFAPVLQPLLTTLGIMPDTPAYLQLQSTARWIVDAADPLAVGRHLIQAPVTPYLTGTPNARKVMIQQEAGMDTTILPQFQAALALEIFGDAGLDGSGHVQGRTTGGTTVSTFFPSAVHSSLIASPPMSSTASEQAQATGWITSSGASLSTP